VAVELLLFSWPLVVVRPLVLVYQPAEDLPASYPRRRQVSDGDRVAVIVIW